VNQSRSWRLRVVEEGCEMSVVTDTTEARADDRFATSHQLGEGDHRVRRRVCIVTAIVVLGWSIVELASLLSRHTTGPELYGVVVAGVAVAAGVLGLVLLQSEQRRLWATVVVLILWGVVAIGGVAGTVAHIVGPVAGHGPIDLRPRPIPAPLIFTVLGLVGGVALWFGQPRRARRANELREE
jgi:drug/metabolite transporter (DMT)-like permease